MTTQKSTTPARPFLKWAGGKRQLLPELIKRVPKTFKNYHEPFLGGGALFFELAAASRLKKQIHLSDLNEELINAFLVVQNNVEELIRALKRHVHNAEYFYRIRKATPKRLGAVARASRLIYLNKTCFNGLYRVNSKGEFNVPFGRYKNPKICDEENLRLCSKALQGVTLRCQPFDAVLIQARAGDLIYFDPPYHPVSKTANFSAYEKSGFGTAEHRRLEEVFTALGKKKCFVMLSNSQTDFTRELFKEHKVEMVAATRSVNSKASGRGRVEEIIVRNF